MFVMHCDITRSQHIHLQFHDKPRSEVEVNDSRIVRCSQRYVVCLFVKTCEKKPLAVVTSLTWPLLDDVVMELYLCLQLLFDSAKNLEMTLKVRGAEEGILTRVHCCSLQCLHQLIEHITRHTALYSSRLLQVGRQYIIYSRRKTNQQYSFHF